MTTLHSVRSAESISAGNALTWLASASSAPSIGFLYSPDVATWFTVDPTGAATGPAGPLDLTGCFEMRAFDGDRELRWLHGADGAGDAVVIADGGTSMPPGLDVTDVSPPVKGTMISRRLAGVPTPAAPGWTLLRSRRFAPAAVPITAAGTSTVVLSGVEYLSEDDHGNLTVVDTRLIGLDTVTEEPWKEA